MSTITHIATVVPARNEATTIVACAESLRAARRLLPPHVQASIVVVADACDDRTAALARAALDPDRDLVLEIHAGSAGAARRTGTEVAIEQAATRPDRMWLCSTDADSSVPKDWLAAHLDAAERGFVAVAGIVHLDDLAEAHVRREFSRTYLTHADGTHHHVHGANLGFRADAYLAAGGWSPLATAEDHDLWNRLTGLGPTTSVTHLSVSTSGRTVGRAPDGFAAALAALATTDTAA